VIYKIDEDVTGTIAVWFSCGAASAVAAKLTVLKYPNAIVRVINNPVLEEDEDNTRFLKDVEKWLGIEIEYAVNPKYEGCSAREVWEKRKFMSSPQGAPCTYELKKKARQNWEKDNKVTYHVLGFTIEEKHRHERFILTERDNVLPVLIDEQVTKQDCYKIVSDSGIELPRVYKMGYPNANCIGCVKATSATYWNLVREKHPEVFKDRAEQADRIGAKLAYYKGNRIPLSQLPEDAKGRKLKGMDFECGIFCEEDKAL